MKRVFLITAILVMAAAGLSAQPKVAVLDAVIPQNMDPSVVVPVTEKIVERLVVSGRFTVLDRANIESVLKEREFQVSGMVSDQDVVTAGKYLGADFVVVAKVQKVGDTYFISAKMIAIKTGVIANQTSAQGEGKLSTLISIAEQVGEVLSGGAVLAQSAAGEPSDISKPVRPTKTKPRQVSISSSKSTVGVNLLYASENWTMKGDDFGTTYSYIEKPEYLIVSGFYDAKFLVAEVGIGASMGGSYVDDTFYSVTYDSGKITNKQAFVSMGVSGKFPITFGSITVFPIAGVEYDLNLSYTDSAGNDLKAGMDSTAKTMLERLYVKGGLGLDYSISQSMIFRIQALYAYKFKSENDKSWDTWAIGYPYTNYSNITSKVDIVVGVGIKL
jgi:hypothetical protein